MKDTAIKNAIRSLPQGQIEAGILLNEDFMNCALSSRLKFRQKVYSSRRGIISKWRRYGLSEICSKCNMLTPLRYMRKSKAESSAHTHILLCKKCREKTAATILPEVPQQSKSL